MQLMLKKVEWWDYLAEKKVWYL